MEEVNANKKAAKGSVRDPSAIFDRSAALKAAGEEVEKAMRVSKSVEDFHKASERIEESQKVIAENSTIRKNSVRIMRESGYSAAKISELTGLSPSTIQKMSSS